MDSERETAKQAMLRRMEEGPFPFGHGSVVLAGVRAIGQPDNTPWFATFCYRLADRLIQVERKAGRINQEKRGKWVRVQEGEEG